MSRYLSNDDLARIDEVKCILQKDYRYHITHAQLAKLFHTSERKLRADFKKVNKKSIYEYLTEIRIEKAKELLKETYKPVKAVAYLVGYHASNLDKQFRKLTGMAPMEWRKTCFEMKDN